MKKLEIWLLFMIVAVIMSGCSNGSTHDESNVDYSNYRNASLTTLFLVDEHNFAYGYIPYKCDSMYEWSRTAPNGEFSFVEPDSCLFDFNGLHGVYNDEFDDVVRIVDDRADGKEGIPYECASFGAFSTYVDGSFDYDENDVCVFSF